MKVLFIGNSHTYVHDMPFIFKTKAKEKGIDVDVVMIAHPGWHLKKHLENPEVRFNILYGDYDYIVVQEHAHPFGPKEEMFESLRTIHDFVKQTKSKMMIYPTWAAKNNPSVQTYMSESHREIQRELNVLIAQVDTNWVNDDKELLYGGDGEHPSVYGSNLIARSILDAILEDLKK